MPLGKQGSENLGAGSNSPGSLVLGAGRNSPGLLSPAFYMEPHVFCGKETETSKVVEESSNHSV